MAINDLQATYLHQCTEVFIPTEADLDAALSANVAITLLGIYSLMDANIKDVKVLKTMFAPTPCS